MTTGRINQISPSSFSFFLPQLKHQTCFCLVLLVTVVSHHHQPHTHKHTCVTDAYAFNNHNKLHNTTHTNCHFTHKRTTTPPSSSHNLVCAFFAAFLISDATHSLYKVQDKKTRKERKAKHRQLDC